MNTRLRQGDAFSPIIFNLVLKKIVRLMNISSDEEAKLDETLLSLLAYPDDISFLGSNINTVKMVCERLTEAAKRVSLQVNEKKIEYIKVRR